MLQSLRHGAIFMCSAVYMLLNLALWTLPITIASLIRLCIPTQRVVQQTRRFNNMMMRGWLFGNRTFFCIFNEIKWQEDQQALLDPRQWYILISNHISWLDTLVLGHLLGHQIPVPKFFLKKQLLYVPFVGLACWGLDMPFMQRYSRNALNKNPHLRGRDLETTIKSCKKFHHIPTTIVNFVEGTRATPNKLASQLSSEFRYLLPPKAAGLAYAIGALGQQTDNMLDVTLYYPQQTKSPIMDLMCGRIKRIDATITQHKIPEKFRNNPYFYTQNPKYKKEFQQWLLQIWKEKDHQLHLMKNKSIEAQSQAKHLLEQALS